MSIAPSAVIENTIIRASAGSGKTNALAQRFLRLMASGMSSRHVLASTFTRKAAGEILDRIMTSLADIATDAADADEIKQRLNLKDLSADQCRTILRQLLANLHSIRIGTIDSFFAALARSFCWELGLPADWEIATPAEVDRIMNRAVSAILSREDSIQLLQLMAKGESFRGAHQLMTATIGDLYQIFLDSRADAWFKMPEHPTLNAPDLARAIQCLETVAIDDKRMLTARTDDVARAVAENWDAWISTGLAGKIVDGTCAYFKKPIPSEVIAAYQPLIDHVRGLVANELKKSTEATYALLERFHQQFDAAKAEVGKLRFDDVTRRLADWTARRADAPATDVSFRLDGSLDHLLIDEFQDTSADQWRVLEPFARRATASSADGTFFCVGDEKQAIFGWRGGVSEIFQLVESQIPHLREASLTHSYRSAQILVDTFNGVFQHIAKFTSNNELANRIIHRWCQRYSKHTTEKTELPGHAVLEKVSEEEGTIARAVAIIGELYRREPRMTIGVLTRENIDVAKLIHALHQADLPASEEGGNPLTDSAAVLLVLSLAHLSDHPSDSAAWFHLVHSPLASAYELPRCGVRPDRSDEVKVKVHRAAAVIRRELLEKGYGATVSRWARILAPQCTQREIRRLQKLVELADEFDSMASLRPSEFVRHVKDSAIEDPTASQIRVMTIHKAKGLEFDAVVLPCLSKRLRSRSSDILIHRDAPTEPISLVLRYAGEEKRRLLPEQFEAAHAQQWERSLSESMCELYVALTRAKHSLHMLVSPKDNPTSLSMAGILLATLTDPQTPGGIVYQHGSADWVEYLGQEKSKAKATDPTHAPSSYDHADKRQLNLVKAPSRTRNRMASSPSRSTPSGALWSDGIPLADRRAAQDRGSRLHAILAEIEWLDGSKDRERLSNSLRKKYPGDNAWSGLLDDVLRKAEQGFLRSVLCRDKYLERISPQAMADRLIFDALTVTVHRERPFAIRQDELIISGVIDRLVLIHEGDQLVAADVIEFKTDRAPDESAESLQALVENYRPQVQAYRRAVGAAHQLPLDRVFGRLVMVGIDREFEIR